METLWLLVARYQGKPIIPVNTVISDFFPNLSREVFLRKVSDGEIKLPLVKMETSQKAAKGVHVNDLAAYLDARHAEAKRDYMRQYG